MELRFLEEFLMLARYENFSAAAEKLFVSQASLSKHIKALEKELGVPLFERTTRSVRLSNFGRVLLPFAEQVTAKYKQFETQMKKERERSIRMLRIVSIPVMAQYGITDLLYAFQDAHPEVQLIASEQEGSQINGLLAKGEFDLAFNRIPHENDPASPYLEIPYCIDHLVAVMPEGHPLAGKETISLSSLRSDPFLLMDENSYINSISIEACQSAGFTPRTIYKGHHPENIIGFVAQGMGVSLLMKRHTEFYKNPGIVTAELTEQISSCIGLLYRCDHPQSVTMRTFISFVQQYLSQQNTNEE